MTLWAFPTFSHLSPPYQWYVNTDVATDIAKVNHEPKLMYISQAGISSEFALITTRALGIRIIADTIAITLEIR